MDARSGDDLVPTEVSNGSGQEQGIPDGPGASFSHRAGGAMWGAAVNRSLHGFSCLTAFATFLLIIAGGLVTSTGSGLAVPDWPLSYGRLMPPMVGGIFYEHGHRLIAGTVATMMLILAVWLASREPRRWVKGLGFAALGAVLLQAVLGGLTVLYLLPTWISVTHACLAQTFFCLTVTLALVTSPRWPRRSMRGEGALEAGAGKDLQVGVAARVVPVPLGVLALACFAAVYVQLVLGALMRHTDSGLAIPDFPLAFGRLVPPHWSRSIAIHFAHRLWALVVLSLGFALVAGVLRYARAKRGLVRPALLLGTLLPIQIALGGLTVLSLKQAALTTAHVATGALILATSLVLAVRSWVRAPAGRFDATSAGAPSDAPRIVPRPLGASPAGHPRSSSSSGDAGGETSAIRVTRSGSDGRVTSTPHADAASNALSRPRHARRE